MTLKPLYFSFLSILLGSIAYAQQDDSIEELESKLRLAVDDTSKISYCVRLSELYTSPKEAKLYAKLALNLSKNTNDKTYKIKAYHAMFSLLRKEGNYEEAIKYCKEEYDIYVSEPETLNLAKCSKDLGVLYLYNHQYDLSIKYLSEARDLFFKLNEKEEAALVINRIGQLKKITKQYGQALKDYLQSLKIFEEINDKKQIAKSYNNIGIIHKLLSNYEKSKEFYQKSLQIGKEINDSSIIADAYNNWGNVLRVEKVFDLAEDYYFKSLNYRAGYSNSIIYKSRKSSYVYNNLGLTYLEKKNYNKAIEFFMMAIEIKFSIKDWESLTSTYSNIAEAYLAINDFKNAHEYLSKAQEIALNGNSSDLVFIYKNLSLAYEKENDFKKALNYLQKSIKIKDSLTKINQADVVLLLTAQFDHENQKNEIDLLEKKNQQLTQQQNEINESEKRYVSLNRIMIFLIVALIIAVIVAYRKATFAKTTAEQLEETNKELVKTLISKDEKDILIKEIHHRVKNNLQIIKSLVRLQLAVSENQEANEILSEFEQRVSSMALVHEELYKSKDLTKVKVKHYLTELVTNLIHTYSIKKVDTDINIESITFGIDTVVPLGLLVNEIISNALKHGIKDIDKGKIICRITPLKGNKYELFIGDNGAGFPENFNFENPATLGLELIQTLSEQLNGEIEIINNDGAFYKITFENLDKDE